MTNEMAWIDAKLHLRPWYSPYWQPYTAVAWCPTKRPNFHPELADYTPIVSDGWWQYLALRELGWQLVRPERSRSWLARTLYCFTQFLK